MPLLQVPLTKQRQESDCLAACAEMSLLTLGVKVGYKQLLKTLNITPWGTPHRTILNLENQIPNIQISYQQGELFDLFARIESGLPVIAFVWTEELPYWEESVWHAVVMVGFDNTFVYLHDPMFDEVQHVSHGDFDLAWLAYDTYFAVIEKG